MDTYFASPEYSSSQELNKELKLIMSSSVITELLKNFGSMMAILNTNRQIIAVNDSFLKALGVTKPEEVHGLRPGQAVKCIHGYEDPAGCGTTAYCSTCGAAIALLASILDKKYDEEICIMEVEKDGKRKDLVFQVSSNPIRVNEHQFVLMLLKDITEQQERAMKDRMFIHDTNNMIGGLLGASELLQQAGNDSPLMEAIVKTTLRLSKEMEIQSLVLQEKDGSYKAQCEALSVKALINDLNLFLKHHPVKKGKTIEFSISNEDYEFCTDRSILLRIIENMIINALEASEPKGRVKLSFLALGDEIEFRVENPEYIPEKFQKRIFQRNFSTKEENGRGIGTYSMKVLGEQILKGRVSFSSSKDKGTVFTLKLNPPTIEK